jgi:sRNA-binding regulator protein Hfq
MGMGPGGRMSDKCTGCGEDYGECKCNRARTDSVKATIGQFQFVPRLRGKRVTLRFMGGGQPATGVLVGYNNFELLLDVTPKGGKLHKEVIYLKHAIISIEPVDEIRI